MRIHAINAFEGDCLLLESGGPQATFALIDGGPRGTFRRHLREYLGNVVGDDGTLEAVIVSHVDADHISGVLDLLADIEARRADEEASRLKIRDLWHNSFTRTIDDARGSLTSYLQTMMGYAGRAQLAAANGSVALLGIAQGAKLRRQATNLEIPLNDQSGGELISVDQNAGNWVFGECQFTVVGPTETNLQELRRQWAKWIEDNLDAFAEGDVQAMANADKSVPNLSSIVLFGTTPHGDILLTGDARGDHILQGMEQAGVIAPGGSHHFRLLKLQHHGSIRNLDRDFLERMTADIYLISADGKHGNPDLDTLTMLVDVANEQQRTPLLVVTNEPQSVEDLKVQRPIQQFGYRLEARSLANHAIVVDLASGTVS